MPNGDELLGRPVEEGARRLALAQLERAEAAAARLADPGDSDALHDFRVALRRLRSLVRAFRPWLAESLSPRLCRRLRVIASATNAGRDAEVQLAWLERQADGLRRHERLGLSWLSARLAERREAAYSVVRDETLAAFSALAARLRQRLGSFRIDVELALGWKPRALGAVVAEALATHGQALADDLARVGALADQSEIHAARIEAKRLRYLLEPFVDELAGARELIGRLRGLQDLLGELNDARLLAAELAAAAGDAAAERARRVHQLALASGDERALRAELRRSERAGLLALGRRLQSEQEELFAALQRSWLAGQGAPFFADLAQLVPRA